jgi:hypothetical protein
MTVARRSVPLPAPRGPASQWVLDIMRGAPSPPPTADLDGAGDDVQLALYLCYEVQYTGLAGTEHLEWNPALVAARSVLERFFVERIEREIASCAAGRRHAPASPTAVGELARQLLDTDDSPSLSRHMEAVGTLDQMRDVVLHRSPYQLKEGDGHTAGVQRLAGPAKQILVKIQAGEYGADAPGRRTHAALFADTMSGLGLDPTPNAYLDTLPGSALAVSNLISLVGTNRRWRGALVGQLAAFEMTSVVPMGRYGRALERLGARASIRRFYDVHVLVDAEHELLALDMIEAQCAHEPATADDVVFGVQATLVVERWFAETLLRSWSSDTSAPGASSDARSQLTSA